MSTDRIRTVARLSMRAGALIGILPGAIVAAAYVLVLSRQLYHHWDAQTAAVLGMATWGVLGVVALWHEYVRLTRNVAAGHVSPRVVLFVWALLLVAFAGWKADVHPWAATFLALVALYSFSRAFGLLRYATRSPVAARRACVARSPPGARAREDGRSRARTSNGDVRSRKKVKLAV